jgi:hypothetical protein
MRGWWQDDDGAWHPPSEPMPAPPPQPEPDVEPEVEPEAVAEAETEAEAEVDEDADAGADLEPESYEPEFEPDPEPTVVETRLAPAPVRPGLVSRPVFEPEPEPEFEPELEPEPTLVETTTVLSPAPARPAPPRPAVVHRPPPVPPPDERRWHTGHLIAAAVAGLLIGAFIGAALKDDSPSTTLATRSSTTALVTSTTTQSAVPGLFNTTAPSGFGAPGGQSQGGPNITAENPFGGGLGIPSATSSSTTLFGSGLSPTTTSGAVTPLTSFVGDGTFRVGTDIQPGTYRSNGPATPGVPCAWERQATFGDSTSVIDANAVLEPVSVTILPSDRGFRTARCQTWTRVS